MNRLIHNSLTSKVPKTKVFKPKVKKPVKVNFKTQHLPHKPRPQPVKKEYDQVKLKAPEMTKDYKSKSVFHKPKPIRTKQQ